jgi:acyl-CoA thioesterase FadM
MRESDRVTLARAEVEYACIELSTGRPARWPPEFKERYVSIDAVMEKVGSLPPV